jgi:hypothetical protein
VNAFDTVVLVLLLVFFAGYLNIHYDLIGLRDPPIPVTKGIEELWDWLGWGVFGLLAVDLYLKYRKVGDPKEFVRKHWLDILAFLLIPLFAGLKLAKVAVKAVKALKLAKSGLKAFKKARHLRT